MALEANTSILFSLRDFYANLVENTQLPVEWAAEEKNFSRSIRSTESEIHRFETRFKRLTQLAADQISLVCTVFNAVPFLQSRH